MEKFGGENNREKEKSVLVSTILQALFIGGLAVARACNGIPESAMEKLPNVTITEIHKNPKKYEAMRTVRTQGYPVYLRRSSEGSGSAKDFIDKRSYEYFELHEGIEKTGNPPLIIFIDKGEGGLDGVLEGIMDDLRDKRTLKPGLIMVAGKVHDKKDGPVLEVLGTKNLTK